MAAKEAAKAKTVDIQQEMLKAKERIRQKNFKMKAVHDLENNGCCQKVRNGDDSVSPRVDMGGAEAQQRARERIRNFKKVQVDSNRSGNVSPRPQEVPSCTLDGCPMPNVDGCGVHI